MEIILDTAAAFRLEFDFYTGAGFASDGEQDSAQFCIRLNLKDAVFKCRRTFYGGFLLRQNRIFLAGQQKGSAKKQGASGNFQAEDVIM